MAASGEAMVERGQAGAILTEMVEIVRAFQVAGQRSRDRTLTGTKVGVLRQLRDGAARVGTLADALVVSAPVASRAVEALEADGMVTRRTDAEDGRALLISITDRGRAALAEREDYFVGMFTDALSDWSPDEATRAVDILQRLNGHLADVFGALEATAPRGDHAEPDGGRGLSSIDDKSEGDR